MQFSIIFLLLYETIIKVIFFKKLIIILKFFYHIKVALAERKGFEPLIPLTVYTLSKRAPSTTRPSLLFVFIYSLLLFKKIYILGLYQDGFPIILLNKPDNLCLYFFLFLLDLNE